MIKSKNITKTHIIISIILLVGFFRIIYSLTAEYKISCDPIEYHNIAYNMVKNKTYSLNPIKKGSTFYREPGYPLFLASIYYIWKIFGGNIKPITKIEWKKMELTRKYPEIRFSMLIQSIFSTLSCIFLFLVLNLIFNKKISFITTILYGLFYISIYYDSFLMRESFQTSISIISSYFFAKFIINKKFYHFVIYSVLCAILVLILKVALLLPLFTFIILFIKWKNIKKSFKYSIFCFSVIFLISLPWLLRSYREFNHPKIFLNWGTTLTIEKLEYVSASRKYERLTNKKHELGSSRHRIWEQGLKETYYKSIKNHYKEKTNIINEDIRNKNPNFFLIDRLNKIIKSIISVLYHPPHYVLKRNLNNDTFIKYMSKIFGSTLGIFFIIGFISNLNKYYYLFFTQLYYLFLYLIMGIGSVRHFAPTKPLFIFFMIQGIIIIFDFYQNFRKGKTKFN